MILDGTSSGCPDMAASVVSFEVVITLTHYKNCFSKFEFIPECEQNKYRMHSIAKISFATQRCCSGFLLRGIFHLHKELDENAA
jgi:hypothetical protein